MAKAAAINLSEAFSLPPQAQVVNAPSTFGDFLPSLPNAAGPGPGSTASTASKLSSQAQGVYAAKERASTGSSHASKRYSGPVLGLASLQPGPHLGEGSTGAQQNAKLPPLMPSYRDAISPVHSRSGTWTPVQQQVQQVVAEPIQPTLQHAGMLPGPTPAAHPYQPKRKPPSAFMRNNPMRQQLEASQVHRLGSAGSSRSYGAASYDNMPSTFQQGDVSVPHELQQQQQFADEVIAAARAAILQGQQPQGWVEDNIVDMGGFTATPPWGVSSVSDLEALDSILDQLVVVDARMRKALLKGPLISFETVVPEHVMNGPRPPQPQRGGEDDKDRTFLTAVKGVAEEGAGEAEAGERAAGAPDGAGEVEPTPSGAGGPPPSPVAREDTAAAYGGPAQASRSGHPTDDSGEPRDSSLFPASIPNPGMHPTFTRAYLASKLAAKPQHLPPPAPATAEHLLRSRPPPFIAAPSYDQLCSQIRDVQRQYTCGTARPGQSAAGVGAGTAVVATIVSSAAATNQYIAGLDGPTLDEVVAHQELPISLERARPTFVALKQKAVRPASPKRRPGSPGRIVQSDGPGETAGGLIGLTL